jgi:hypothetical protein
MSTTTICKTGPLYYNTAATAFFDAKCDCVYGSIKSMTGPTLSCLASSLNYLNNAEFTLYDKTVIESLTHEQLEDFFKPNVDLSSFTLLNLKRLLTYGKICDLKWKFPFPSLNEFKNMTGKNMIIYDTLLLECYGQQYHSYESTNTFEVSEALIAVHDTYLDVFREYYDSIVI